jgi:hypothetical protein
MVSVKMVQHHNKPHLYAGQTPQEQHALQLKQHQIVQQVQHSILMANVSRQNKWKYLQIQMANVQKELIVWVALVMLVSLELALLFVLRTFL